MSCSTEQFDDLALVVSAGTVVEFYSNGLVYVRRRIENGLVVQSFRFADGKWECFTRQDLDDAPPVEVTISIARDL